MITTYIYVFVFLALVSSLLIADHSYGSSSHQKIFALKTRKEKIKTVTVFMKSCEGLCDRKKHSITWSFWINKNSLY